MPRSVRHTGSVEEAFGIVLFVVVACAAVIALLTLASARRSYDDIGKGGFSLNEDRDWRDRPAPTSQGVVDEEIRQLLTARNSRHTASGRGEIVDIETELARLKGPQVDEEILAEVRSMVQRRNRRRVAKGEAPLDEEAEIARQLKELGAT